MEAAPGILHRDYEKKRRRDVVRQAPSLRTEWVGWRHSTSLHWTSHDHEWDPLGPPSTSGRSLHPVAARKESAGNCCLHRAQITLRTAHLGTRLLCLSKEILRS